eukprot:1186195-Prorocentrum_minimum.AAC.4
MRPWGIIKPSTLRERARTRQPTSHTRPERVIAYHHNVQYGQLGTAFNTSNQKDMCSIQRV